VSKKNFINKSYKDKLRATYTSLMFLVLILLSAFLYYQVNNMVKPIIGKISVYAIDSEAQNFGQRFYNQKNILELLSTTEAFRSGDFLGIKKEIDNQMQRYGDLFISMKFKSINGQEYYNNPRNIIMPANYENQLLSGDKLNLITQTVYNDKIGEYISFTGTRVKDNKGKIVGTLIINAGVKKLISSVKKTKISELGEMWIFDSVGNVIVKPSSEKTQTYDAQDIRKQISGKPYGQIKIVNSIGDSSHLSYSEIPYTQGLYLAMGIEHKDYLAAMKLLMLIIFISAILACTFIFVFANKMANFITKPLTRMVKIIQNSDGTNFIEIPKDLKDSKDEIGILANTIDDMARNIRNNLLSLNSEIKERQKAQQNLISLNDKLECRVEERTKELTVATNSLAVSEDRFRIAMEAAHIGLYDFDCVSNELVVNGVLLKLMNSIEYKQGTIKESDWVQYKKPLEDVIYDVDIPGVMKLGVDNLTTIQEDFYEEFRLKDDLSTWLSMTGQAVQKDESGKVNRFIGVIQNISDRKRTEVELKTAKEQAEESSLAKSQFLANMSHEIRTPMNAIMGLTHLIGQSDLNDFQKNYVSKIEGSSKTLLRIINDILDFSKIEAGKFEIENIKFNLDKVMENISNLYAYSATNKGIDINFDTGEAVPDILIGDPLRLEQVICNLTTNAIKFTNSGEVNVAVRVAEETENSVKLHFSVIDTGIGLKQEQIERLFTAFAQADSSMTRKYGGTGLGLAISKQLVELMNGEIWVESKYGEGTCFQFTIDFEKALNQIKTDYLNYPDLLGKKVLVVDHNNTSLMILERMLKSFSLEVTALRNPYEAIEMFTNENFDLLIIDFNLPELSGTDLYKRLISNTEKKVPKTIFVSATGRENYYNQVNQLGVKNFLVKPINQSLMFDAVMNALKETTAIRIPKNNKELGLIKYQSILANTNILVVEDNEINQLVAKDILEGVGIIVSIASNGYEAINHVHANKFDLVLMDVQMPIMDGYEATEILRKTYSNFELPIIAMTANALKGDRELSIKAGMNDYISKPINPEVLFETLLKWLNDKGLKSKVNLILEMNNKNEILDMEKTLLKLGNKKDFYMELLQKYSINYSKAANELSDLILNKKYDETKIFIHTLKSVTGSIGATKLNTFITEFEQNYDSYDPSVKIEKLEIMWNLNEELLKYIAKLAMKGPEEKSSISNNSDVYACLENLLIVLKKARTKEIKECMNYLVAISINTGFIFQVNEIKELVERYRFKDAKVILEKLIQIVGEGNNG